MKKIRVILKKSPIDKIKKHKLTLKALGLTRIGKSRIFADNKALRGMLNQIAFMVSIEETVDSTEKTAAAHAAVKPRKEKTSHEVK